MIYRRPAPADSWLPLPPTGSVFSKQLTRCKGGNWGEQPSASSGFATAPQNCGAGGSRTLNPVGELTTRNLKDQTQSKTPCRYSEIASHRDIVVLRGSKPFVGRQLIQHRGSVGAKVLGTPTSSVRFLCPRLQITQQPTALWRRRVPSSYRDCEPP